MQGEPLVISDVIMSTPFLLAFNTEFISNWNPVSMRILIETGE